ncbi:MAG: flavin reductase family protein [Planctomycetota bacterium]
MKKSLGAKTLACPAPVWIVCSYDEAGKPNAMAASWAGTACSQPPCLSVSLRKATYSYASLVARKAFTVCVPSEKHLAEADYFGVASGRNTDKFADTGLTAVRSELVDAPYVAEFPLVLECKLVHTAELGLHTQFVGEIVNVLADEEVLSDGALDIVKIAPFVYSPGTRSYYGVGPKLSDGFSTASRFKK